MDSMSAFVNGEANKGKTPMVFDWDKAAQLIKERKPSSAGAGLSGDWEWTGGKIWDGEPILDDYTYLASTWATPELEIDGEIIDCFIMADETEWDEGTKWPESALGIIDDQTD